MASLLIQAPFETVTTTRNALMELAGILLVVGMSYPVHLIGAIAGPLAGGGKLVMLIFPGVIICALTPKLPAIITDTSKIVRNVCVCVTTAVPLFGESFPCEVDVFKKMKSLMPSPPGPAMKGRRCKYVKVNGEL